MQTDFYNSFLRHWRDAEYLYNDSRWANADQLYGYSAECGLKCLMRRFGMYVDPQTGTPEEKNRLHADKIWNRYEAYRAGTGASGYMLPVPNPFDDWNISHRYANESNFNRTHVMTHRNGADSVRALIRKAIIEGRPIV